jgi:hypothetical protein
MANKKITELTALTTPDNADLFAIVDISLPETKKITFADLKTAVISGLTSVYQPLNLKLTTFAALADAAGVLTSDGAGNYSWGAVSSGANTALSNLASVSINTSLLAQASVDLGSTVKPFHDLYLYGAGTFGTHYLKLTGTPTSTRTLTIPDATDTLVGKATTDTFTNKTTTDARWTVITSSAGSATLDDTGTIWVFTGSTTTWTLPAVSGNTNRTFFIKNRGSGILTLQRAGSDNIYDLATVTSILINPGEAYIINNDGTYWITM